MPRFPIHAAIGTGRNTPFPKSIRFVRYGCTNRPFFHIVVMDTKKEQRRPPIELLGSYDPMANKYNEKLVALNIERIQFWLGKGVSVSQPVAELLGLSGFLPIHPRTYMTAWRYRSKAEETAQNEASEATQSAG